MRRNSGHRWEEPVRRLLKQRRHTDYPHLRNHQLSIHDTGHMNALETKPGRTPAGDANMHQPHYTAPHESVDIDVGYALRRIAQLGSNEQLVAFAVALKDQMRRIGRPAAPHHD